MTKHPAWESLLTECFSSTEFITLATSGKDGLWANPVYFAWDKDWNIYFMSELGCLHMDNITENSDVACTLFPTNQSTHGDVFGAYLKGTARVLSGAEAEAAASLYYTRVYPDDPEKRQNNAYTNSGTWHFVHIKPTGLWYFDTRYFGETRTQVPLI